MKKIFISMAILSMGVIGFYSCSDNEVPEQSAVTKPTKASVTTPIAHVEDGIIINHFTQDAVREEYLKLNKDAANLVFVEIVDEDPLNLSTIPHLAFGVENKDSTMSNGIDICLYKETDSSGDIVYYIISGKTTCSCTCTSSSALCIRGCLPTQFGPCDFGCSSCSPSGACTKSVTMTVGLSVMSKAILNAF